MQQAYLYRRTALLLFTIFSGTSAAMAQANTSSHFEIRDPGISGLWVLANVSYAGMRAQNNPNALWRILVFILGLPGTIVTYFAVGEGSERAYGIDLPRRSKQ
jgi:hypothetical protein